MKIQIKIEDNDDLKQVHGLLLELGFSTYNKESFDVWADQPKPIWLKTNVFDDMPSKIDWIMSGDYEPFKEITLPELRDLVVLKRNNRKDANVSEENCLYDLYLTESKELYFYHCGKNKWILSNLNGDDDCYESLKAIEKPMKEYLNKETHEFVRSHSELNDMWIEIPEGAEIYTKYDGSSEFYKSKNGIVYRFDKCCWVETIWGLISEILKECDRCGFDVLWQRAKQPEELPFVDDASLNDQYAEIEKVRQNSKLDKSISDFKNTDHGKEFDLMTDAVNHPSHYASGEIECIDAMRAMLGREQFIGYIRGNIFKYQWRYQNKNGIEDLKKSEWYLNKLLEVENEL